MKFLILISLLILCSCNEIKYQADIGFLNSAQANSFEYFVTINGAPCKDMDNKIGLCAKRIESNAPLKFKIDPKPYGYSFNLRCTKELNSDYSINIAKDQAYEFSIAPEKFATVKSFTCIGEIFPEDRPQEISGNFQVRAIVFDSNYIERELVYTKEVKKDTYLVFGKYAKYTFLNGKTYKEQTAIKINKDQKNFGYSESENLRVNSYGI